MAYNFINIKTKSFFTTRIYKLLEHAMKVVERIFEHRIRQQIEIDDMQFGFMKGKGTTNGKTDAGEF